MSDDKKTPQKSQPSIPAKSSSESPKPKIKQDDDFTAEEKENSF
jgi:hypothetical protein